MNHRSSSTKATNHVSSLDSIKKSENKIGHKKTKVIYFTHLYFKQLDKENYFFISFSKYEFTIEEDRGVAVIDHTESNES